MNTPNKYFVQYHAARMEGKFPFPNRKMSVDANKQNNATNDKHTNVCSFQPFSITSSKEHPNNTGLDKNWHFPFFFRCHAQPELIRKLWNAYETFDRKMRFSYYIHYEHVCRISSSSSSCILCLGIGVHFCSGTADWELIPKYGWIRMCFQR